MGNIGQPDRGSTGYGDTFLPSESQNHSSVETPKKDSSQPPSAASFYAKNTFSDILGTYTDTTHRYFKSISHNSVKAATTIAASVVMGVFMTAFYRQRSLTNLVYMLGGIGYPVAAVMQQFPKMKKAYQTSKDGDPQKGTAMYKQSLKEVVYKIVHQFLKPLFFAGLVSSILLMRHILSGHAQSLEEKAFKVVYKMFGLKAESKLPKAIDKNIFQPLSKWGNKMVAHLEQYPKIKRILKLFE